MTGNQKSLVMFYVVAGGCIPGLSGEDASAGGDGPKTAMVEQGVTNTLIDVRTFGGNLFPEDHSFDTAPNCDPGSIRALAIPTCEASSALGGSCVFENWVTPGNPKDCRAHLRAHSNGSFAALTTTVHVLEQTGDSFFYAAANTSSATANTINRQFALNAGETLTLGTCGVSAELFSGDTFLRLNGPSGTQVAASDDACGGLGSRLVFIASTTGTYEVRAGCFSSTACNGNVTWTIN